MKHSLKSKEKIIGILGGMGPYATLMFLKNILSLTPAQKDWDHIHTVIDSNPHIPSRSRAILYHETSPLKDMLISCQKLAKYPVDIIVIPCNSACLWVPKLQKQIKIPIINIAKITAQTLSHQKNLRVTVLGSMVVYNKDIYKKSIEKFGNKYIRLDSEIQKKIIEIIEKIKLGDNSANIKNDFMVIIKNIIEKQKVEVVILACTELTEFKDLSIGIPLIDSSFVLAQYVVNYVKNKKEIFLDNDKVKNFWNERGDLFKKNEIGLLQSSMLTLTEKEAEKKDKLEKQKLLKILKPFLSKNKIMLELGCGYGRLTHSLATYVKKIDAYDYNQNFIDLAKEKAIKENIKNIDFFCSPVEKISLNKKYDYIISIALLHYLNEDQYDKTISIIKQAIKKNGLVFFRESFGYLKRFELHGYYSEILNTEYYAIYRTSDELIQKMGENFSSIYEEILLSPTKEKPETCQKIFIFKKK